MKYAGIDIGSRFIKYVITEDSKIIEFYKESTGHNPLGICNEMIKKTEPDMLTATGYGRYLLELKDIKSITEIKAVSIGAKKLFPYCRTVIDIGGQDTKVIGLDESGHVSDFEMNDRCAAGTGKFIEIMSQTLGYKLEDFGNESTCAIKEKIKINSMCTVFAESEVISLIAKGTGRHDIAWALHNSIIDKIIPLVNRVGLKEDIVFAGGCARNVCLKNIIEERLKKNIWIYENPEIIAAFGAALYGQNNH
ncbi:MAG: acyl-CoA dehydratase activase [Candidatus Eremiobacterota bacterium]